MEYDSKNRQLFADEKTISADKITILLFVFYALKTAWLAFDKQQYSPLFFYVGEILVVLCVPFALLTLLSIRQLDITWNNALLILPLINWGIQVFHSNGEVDMLRQTYTLLVIYAFIFLPSMFKYDIFSMLYRAVLFIGIISNALYIIYSMGINIGFQTLPYYAVNIHASYIKWFIFAMYKDNIFLRSCGIFNEPGGFGTVCALLFIARYKQMCQWEKAVFLISIVFSFSLAGVLLLFVFALVNSIFGNRKRLYLIVPLIAVILIVPYIDFGNAAVNNFVYRLRITADGLEGDNRTKQIFDLQYQDFLHSDKLLFGHGANYVNWEGVLSYKTYVMQYGVLGFGLWIIVWALAGLCESDGNRESLIFLICFMLSIYQRPRLLESIYGYVLLFGGIDWIVFTDQERQFIPIEENKL